MKSTNALVAVSLVAFVITIVCGCAPEVERLRQSIAHPGPAAYQRSQAIQHDPYPLDDVGPEVVGARPREYQRPLNEVERARLAAPVPAGVQAIQRSQPIGPAPIAGPAYPVAPGPFPSSGASAPVVTTPPTAAPIYAVPGNAPAQSFQTQPRAPY